MMLNGEQFKLHNCFIRPHLGAPKLHTKSKSTVLDVVKSAGEADAKQTGETMELAHPAGHSPVLREGCAHSRLAPSCCQQHSSISLSGSLFPERSSCPLKGWVFCLPISWGLLTLPKGLIPPPPPVFLIKDHEWASLTIEEGTVTNSTAHC